MIITIKITTWGESNKFKDTIFENTNNFWFSKVVLLFVAFNDCKRKERAFEEVVFNNEKDNVINMSFECYQHMYQVLVEKGIEDFFSGKFCKTVLVFCCKVVIEVILKLVLGKVFLHRHLLSH